ncbi:hypothetical protein [Salinimicrobium oceani]|uniref:Phage protein n=1 Tax=Salinimicrobium oceani TaxID=2722702 RepID=A0ABX1D3P6_9FLAO|nr:hypothetical protein [Salinimicrobium oceani]NJW53818.1 hypothetical protein [Salinimicrobium oceani]
MSISQMNKTGTELFQSYLRNHKDDVRSTAANNYYHVDVVAEAFNEGFSAGEKSGKKEFVNKLIKSRVEELTQKANQVYILTNRVISFIKQKGHAVDSFYINIFHDNPQVVIAVDNDLLINDDFVTQAYSKVFEMKRIFNDLFDCALDMGIMGAAEIDVEALKADGFEYSEDFNKNEE